jgi:hypothetical protein
MHEEACPKPQARLMLCSQRYGSVHITESIRIPSSSTSRAKRSLNVSLGFFLLPVGPGCIAFPSLSPAL